MNKIAILNNITVCVITNFKEKSIHRALICFYKIQPSLNSIMDAGHVEYRYPCIPCVLGVEGGVCACVVV